MIINTAFRLLLTLNATSLLVIIFLVQKGYTLGPVLSGTAWLDWTELLPNSVSYLIYFLIPVLSTGGSILLSSKLGKDDFKSGEVERIEHANNSFLPSYLGYFFVALSIESWEALGFVYSVLFLFTFLSQALYFNPLFLLFGYEFYNITTKNGTAIFLISCQKYKKPDEVQIPVAYRINNYTFIERK
ncbi:hypothetical protein [Halomonas sp. PGE1]|jgi:hypothetical protein|uniref:hypothetical protein n=1 Tax=Halomonas sp. PGE1 TaxID=2730360 RepID=UPI0014729FF3|nr:hypothetical protein [Halomonas sp. PGE1]